jgi:hypothetical protein
MKNEHEITINKLELASELAHQRLELIHEDKIKIYEDEDADELIYTDKAQDIFNEYYDYYLDVIQETSID